MVGLTWTISLNDSEEKGKDGEKNDVLHRWGNNDMMIKKAFIQVVYHALRFLPIIYCDNYENCHRSNCFLTLRKIYRTRPIDDKRAGRDLGTG